MNKLCILSNFNNDNLKILVQKKLTTYSCSTNDYGSLFPFLVQANSSYELAITWITTNDLILAESLNFNLVLQLEMFSKNVKTHIVILPTVNSNHLNQIQNRDLRSKIYQFNLELFNSKEKNIVALDPTSWFISAGENAFSEKHWYLSKSMFHPNVLKIAVENISWMLNAQQGKNIKLIIVDLDDTLWGGVVGDDGINHIKLGGHDAIGESFVDFQKQLKELKDRGVLLAICSKNTNEIAMDAIENHPEMVLKKSDFVSTKINWNDKAENCLSIINEVNILPENVLFLDDSMVERERVKSAIQTIHVPALPEDKLSYTKWFQSLPYFYQFSFTEEDKKRTESYLEEIERKRINAVSDSIEDFITSLQVKVEIKKLEEINKERVIQLLNKTNQMNYATRRLTNTEFDDWCSKNENQLYTVHVSDKLGDSGLTGIVSFTVNNTKLTLVDFILSCRVMGRKVENEMIDFVKSFAKENKLEVLPFQVFITEKNKPIQDFFERLK